MRAGTPSSALQLSLQHKRLEDPALLFAMHGWKVGVQRRRKHLCVPLKQASLQLLHCQK